jgi:hypothetical protein
MCGAIPPLTQYAFMAWCSVKKAQGQLLHLPSIIVIIIIIITTTTTTTTTCLLIDVAIPSDRNVKKNGG